MEIIDNRQKSETTFEKLNPGEIFIDNVNFDNLEEGTFIKLGRDWDGVIDKEELEDGDGVAVNVNDGGTFIFRALDAVVRIKCQLTIE